ncbi:unnamed protein product [Closterium sp. NIES-53]
MRVLKGLPPHFEMLKVVVNNQSPSLTKDQLLTSLRSEEMRIGVAPRSDGVATFGAGTKVGSSGRGNGDKGGKHGGNGSSSDTNSGRWGQGKGKAGVLDFPGGPRAWLLGGCVMAVGMREMHGSDLQPPEFRGVRLGDGRVVKAVSMGEVPMVGAGGQLLRIQKVHLPFPHEASRALGPLDEVHMDLWGPVRTTSLGGAVYVLSLIDDFTRRVWSFPLPNKESATVANVLRQWHKDVELECGRKLKAVRSDRGGEFLGDAVKAWKAELGIKTQLSVADTPQQNGVVERWHRTMAEGIRTLLVDSGLPARLWGEALMWVVWVKNRVTHSAFPASITPMEAWSGQKPHVGMARSWGCMGSVMLHGHEKGGKLDARAVMCVCVGVDMESKGWRMLDPSLMCIRIARDVDFLENVTWKDWDKAKGFGELLRDAAAISQLLPLPLSPPSAPADDVEMPPSSLPPAPLSVSVQQQSTPLQQLSGPSVIQRRSATQATSASSSSGGEEVGGDAGVVEGMLCLAREVEGVALAGVSTGDVPRTLAEALRGPEGPAWKASAEKEVNAMRTMGVWDPEPVDLPQGKKAIGVRYIFRRKTDKKDKVVQHKVRLVAKGYTQEPEKDYDKVFAPVGKLTSGRVLLAEAAVKGWHVQQEDVDHAYLNAVLQEEVYVRQPEGFDDGTGRVYRLRKALYGLKQAPRAWNEEIGTTLIAAGFDRSACDEALYISESAASSEALHTYTLDSSASRCFFRECTIVTTLATPVPVSMADPSGGPVVAWASTVLPCLAVPSGSLSGLHLPSFSTNLVSDAVVQDVWVDTVTPGGQRVAICPARVSGTDQERFFLLVFDDYMRYTTVFPLRSKMDVSGIMIPWIRATLHQLCERFRQDLPVLRLHSDRGSEFSSDLLAEFCRDEGIVQSFTLPASPQQNGIAEQTSSTLGWTGEVGDVSAFWVWGALSLVRDTTASKLPPCTLRCAFLGFPTDAPPWRVYHPRSRRVLSSQDVTLYESVCFYMLHLYASHAVPLAPVFLVPVPPPVEPLPPQGLAPSAVDNGATGGGDTGGEDAGGAGLGGAETGVAETGGAGPRGAETGDEGSGGADSGGAASPSGGGAVGAPAAGPGVGQQQPPSQIETPSPQLLRKWVVRRGRSGAGDWSFTAPRAAATGGAGAAGAGGTGGVGAAGPRGARTRGARAAGAGGAAGVGRAGGAAGARGARAGGTGDAGAAGLRGARTRGAGATGAGGTAGVGGAGGANGGAGGAGAAGTGGAGAPGAGGAAGAGGTGGTGAAGARGFGATGTRGTKAGGTGGTGAADGTGTAPHRSFFYLQSQSSLPPPEELRASGV